MRFEHLGAQPRIHPDAVIAPTAVISGDVRIGADCQILHGAVLTSAGGPLIHLEVSPQYPLVVDPDAFVCAKGQLTQSFVTDVSWRSVVGQGSGEAFSLKWDGTGVVSIQPAER